MTIEFSYAAKIELNSKEIKEIVISAPPEADIVEYVEIKIPKPYKILEIYSISAGSSYKLSEHCMSCQHNSLGQLAHMEHPDGCLHVASLCDFCV